MTENRNIRPFGVRLVWCEVISASLLLGIYFGSIGISLATLGLFGLILHFLLSQYRSDKLVSALVSTLWAISASLWGSWLDEMAATSYITIILTILVICISYWGNIQVLRWPEIDQWFQSSSSKDW